MSGAYEAAVASVRSALSVARTSKCSAGDPHERRRLAACVVVLEEALAKLTDAASEPLTERDS